MMANRLFIQKFNFKYLAYGMFMLGFSTPSKIRYIEDNAFKYIYQKCLNLISNNIDIEKISIKDNWYKREELELEISLNIYNEIFQPNNFLNDVSPNLDKSLQESFIRKIIVRKIRSPLTILIENNFSANDTIIISHSGLGISLENSIKNSFPDIKNIFYFRETGLIYYFSRYTYISLNIIFRAMKNLFKHKKESEKIRPSIGISYNWGINEDYYDQDDGWIKHVLSPHRAIIYFDQGAKKPATNKIIKQCLEKNYEFRILNKRSNATRYVTHDYSKTELEFIFNDFFLLFNVFKKTILNNYSLIQIVLLLKLLPNLRRKQAFIKDENIKVLFDNIDTADDLGSLACELEGDSIKIGKHWSYICWPRSTLFPIQRVYFTWSKYISKILQSFAPYPDYIVAGNQFFRKKNSVEGLTNENQKIINGKFVIGLLDRSVSEKSMIPPPYHIEFFRKLIELTERNKDFLILFKPKDTGNNLRIFQYDSGLKELIKKNIAAKKFIMLQGSVNADTIGKYANISVALGVNSAGFNIALNESRVVYWDPGKITSIHGNDIFGENYKNLVFDELDPLIFSIEEYAKNNKNNPNLGNQDSLVERINELEDSKHHYNIGEFVSNYLQNIENGSNRSEAIKLSINK